MKSAHKKAVFGKVIVYAILILIAVVMIIPFLWMLSASIKSDREVFQMNPFVWIPANPKWDNYVKIWTKIPFGRFVGNTVYLTLIVTFLQLLTSSFAAYSFAKLDFRHKNGLFLAYIATIAMPWQVYMVPQFIMMRRMGLNDKLLAMICLQAFSAFGVFMMKQFYEGIPDDLCEAARIDGMSEYRIYASIMLPLSKPALSTLTIFTFVATWNDYLGEEDHPAGIKNVHQPVLFRLRSDHGRIGIVADPGTDRIPGIAEILCRGCCLYGTEGITDNNVFSQACAGSMSQACIIKMHNKEKDKRVKNKVDFWAHLYKGS